MLWHIWSMRKFKKKGLQKQTSFSQDFLATERGMKAMETGRTLFWDFYHEVGTGNDYCWLRRHSHGHGRFRLWWRCGLAFAPDEAWCSPQIAHIQSSGPTGQTKLCFSDFQTRFLFFLKCFCAHIFPAWLSRNIDYGEIFVKGMLEYDAKFTEHRYWGDLYIRTMAMASKVAH